jgi:hypothetical protein
MFPSFFACVLVAASSATRVWHDVGHQGQLQQDEGSFDWIRKIAAGPPGRKVQLEPKTYLIDKQYQLPRGTEVRGAGTAPGHRTVIKAVGSPYTACAGAASAPGLVQGRKGLLLGDDTYVGGFHFVGMETKRLDCLYAPVETPGCLNSEGDFRSPPNETGPCGPAGRNLNCCGGYTGNGGHGVSNATVEDISIEPFTTQNMFFMAPNQAGARVSRDITVRNMRVNGTWADGVNIHGQHSNVLVEGCTVINSHDDCFAVWSVGTGLDNVTLRGNIAKARPGCNCCYANFGGLRSAFLDNHGEGCGLTPGCEGKPRPGSHIPPGSEGMVIFGTINPGSPVYGLFGGAWNSSSVAIVKNMTGTCAGESGCPTCNLIAHQSYPEGFPGTLSCEPH